MRSTGNLHPEWGYFAPAPSVARTVRVALVAVAVGATAGAAVVALLVHRTGSNDSSSVAAQALIIDAPVITSGVAKAPNAKAAILARQSANAKAQPVTSVQSHTMNVVPTVTEAMPLAQAKPKMASGQSAMASGPAPNANQMNPTPLFRPMIQRVSGGSRLALVPAAPAPIRSRAPSRPEEATASIARKKRTLSSEAGRRETEIDARERWREDAGVAPLLRFFGLRLSSSSSPN
jgi:hypothetical protein